MTAKKKQRLINAICCVVLVAGMIATSIDGVKLCGGSQAGQYLFNFIYIWLVMPACIGLSDLPERAHPEHYTTDELRRKGLIK